MDIGDWVHVPVLLEPVLEMLQPRPGMTVVDATAGLGGHAAEILAKVSPGGRVLAIDRDAASLDAAKRAHPSAGAVWIHGNFADLRLLLRDLSVQKVDGVLADLGASSPQLDQAERGFSFQKDGPLDMRMDPTADEPASSLVARLSAKQLADLIFEFGEERFSRRIAARIVAARREEAIVTTGRLAELVRQAVPRTPPWKKRGDRKPIDPATRVFQALRIAVNGELDALDALLAQLPDCLAPGGRAVLISFHSLEDRRVKRAFQVKDVWETLNRKPIVADEAECDRNPRSRSAKLRAAVRR